MKKQLPLLLAATFVILTIASCRREPDTLTFTSRPAALMKAFYDRNKPLTESFTFHAATGYTFTTQKGTVVTVPPNAFVDQSGQPYNSKVTVYITDIYKKSDMLFSKMHTVTTGGMLLESAGEFKIKAVNSIQVPLQLAAGSFIRVEQPLQPQQQINQAMMPFIVQPDSMDGRLAWDPAAPAQGSLTITQTNYIYSLYQFSSPLTQGTWCNSDAPAFGASPTIHLSLVCDEDPDLYATDVFLFYWDVNAMVHVYRDGDVFAYAFAPEMRNCTMVAVGAKDNQLYASFVDVAIGHCDLSRVFTMQPITEEEFKAKIDELN